MMAGRGFENKIVPDVYSTIVIEKEKDFLFLRAMLKNTKTKTIPNVGLDAYGKVVVR